MMAGSAHLLRQVLAPLLLAWTALTGPAAAAQAMPEAPAPIVILVFSAFSCPYCAEGSKMIDGLLAKYPGKLRVVFKHFPLGADDASYLPHEAALAAAQQERFWPMHAALFADQTIGASRASVDAMARRLKLDMARFDKALDRHEGRMRIDTDVAEASALKVVATPTYYIEGYKFEGLHQASVFEQIIDHKLGRSGQPAGIPQQASLKASRVLRDVPTPTK